MTSTSLTPFRFAADTVDPEHRVFEFTDAEGNNVFLTLNKALERKLWQELIPPEVDMSKAKPIKWA